MTVAVHVIINIAVKNAHLKMITVVNAIAKGIKTNHIMNTLIGSFVLLAKFGPMWSIKNIMKVAGGEGREDTIQMKIMIRMMRRK